MIEWCLKREGNRLFDTDDAPDEGYGVEVGAVQLEGGVTVVVGDDEYVVGIGSGLQSLDERSLVGFEHIHLAPLEEKVAGGYALACHEVARAVGREHGVAANLYEEVGPLEDGHHELLALVCHDGRVAGEVACHGADGYERYAFFGTSLLNPMCDGDIFSIIVLIFVVAEHRAIASKQPFCGISGIIFNY